MREQVRERAGRRCEYCRLSMEDESDAPFHIEHIIARQHRGQSIEENLALSCMSCNLHKGTNLVGFDPDTNLPVRLFDPRKDLWQDHFRREGARILGVTNIGRTTAWLLQFNNDLSLLQRRAILRKHPLD